ncbi:MAG: hypothetical protein ACXWJW_09880 [Xanthobacteraceae bacterium]
MARWLLVAATVIDITLAVLLIAISGFIVGTGPESMHAGGWGTAALTAAVLSRRADRRLCDARIQASHRGGSGRMAAAARRPDRADGSPAVLTA